MNARKAVGMGLLLLLAACATGHKATVEEAGPGSTERAAGSERVAEIDFQLRESTLAFDAEGRLTLTRHTIYRVMSGEPSDQWKVLSAAWKPGSEAPPKLDAKVIASDGTVVVLDARTQVDSPMASDVPDVFTDRKLRKAPLPAIGPGALVDATVVTQELKSATPYGSALSWGLVTFLDIKHDVLTITYPTALGLKTGMQHVGAELERSESGGVVKLVLDRRNVKAFDDIEDFTPPSAIALPRVTVATGASWNAVAKGYGASIASKLVLSAALKKTALEVVGDEKVPAQKATKLLRWLREKVRYTGLELEDSGLIPFTPEEVVGRRYGDCKDMSVLLVLMLREVGVPANLALLSASMLPDVQPDLPGVGHFNHAIVYVPGSKLWIDPTETFAAPGQLGANTQNRLSLVIDDATTTLIPTAELSATDNHLKVNIDITLARFGFGKVVRVRETTGLALQQRRSIVFENPENYSNQMTKIAKDVFQTRGQPIISTSKPLELDRPFTERLELPDSSTAHTEVFDATARVDLSSLLEALPFQLDNPEDKSVKSEEETKANSRKGPLLMPHAFSAELVLRAVPPPGYVMNKLPDPIDAKLGPAKFTMRAEKDGQGTVTLRAGLVSARRYTAEEVDTLSRELPVLLARVPDLTFENQPLALADKGKLVEAMEKARALLVKEPNEAMAHVTMATLLLKAHAGVAARKEAKRAVELAPNSPIAHRTLGSVSLHNQLGMWLVAGFDRATAISALTKSLELDPEDSYARTCLIDAYLLNDQAQFNGKGAKFDAALTHLEIYRQKRGNDLDDLYASTLFRAGKHARLDAIGPKLELGIDGYAAWAASAAVLKGTAAGVAVVKRLPADKGEAFGKAMSTLMLTARTYPEFAALTEALLLEGGQPLTPQQKGYFALMKSLKPVESLKYPTSDPRTLVVGLARVMFGGEDAGALKLVDTSKPDELRTKYFDELKKVAKVVENSGVSREAGMDLFVAMMELKREKKLPVGELMLLASPLMPQHPIRIIGVAHLGGWRIHPMTWSNDAAADAIAEALAKKNEEDAKATIRALVQLRPGELARLIGKPMQNGLVGSKDDLALTVAVLHGFGTRSNEAIAPLEAALKKSADRDHATRLGLALALGNSLELQKKWTDLEKFSAMCAADTNLVEIAPSFRGVALRHQKRFTEARQALEKDLLKAPDDPRLLDALARVARQEGRFDLSIKAGQRLFELNQQPAANLSEIAMDAVNTKVDAKAIERAELARNIAATDPNVLATLAALYAEVGRVDDAHEVLKVRLAGVEEANLGNRSWFALGRLAESLALTDVAVDAYQKVKAPDDGEVDPIHALAQKRLATLGTKKRS